MRAKPVVLAIDDDWLFRKALQSVLSRFGLVTRLTTTPDEFLSLAATRKADLYLIDLLLVESSGFDLIKKVRQSDPDAAILVISGESSKMSISQALEMGANDYILKPLDRTLLASKLSHYLHTPELLDHRADFIDLPQGRAPARVVLDLEVEEINELGVKLVSPHLIQVGSPGTELEFAL